ncbi:MAG: hemerythrin family protein [Verrucomicrobiota bacterium]
MLVWNENFATGHKTLDKQHQVLFENVNRLESLLDQTNLNLQETEFILSLVNYLESYVQDHFKLEEQCMESYRCPMHSKNLDAHRQFLLAVVDYKKKFQASGFRSEVMRELHQFMQNWLQQHIMRIDVQLKSCIPVPRSS